ncbi:MAG: TerB family tellurite resistance protein [Rhodothermales bacterium]|nr:TerB family tellurite resistance protein [Rhodothermales bacterium]MBO6781132.1 TerB family tellurite resistance protein [Rhodothermales bacterium]
MSRDHRLEDLAAVFVGLAHGADGSMHFLEFTQIADHLIRWKDPGDETDVLELVDETVARHSPPFVLRAVERLAKTMSERELRAVMEDLSQLALADRKFLREEAEYIVWVANHWKITDSGVGGGAFSSVLRAAWAGL